MALLGIAMGLLAAQLGNVAQSSAGEADRSEVGGLQYTAQNLGSSLGTAFIGSVLIGALIAAAQRGIAGSPQITAAVSHQVGIAISGGVNFVPLDQGRAALVHAGIPADQIDAVLGTYADAQLFGLKVALLAAAAIALFSLFLTRQLPATRLAGIPKPTRSLAAEEVAAGRRGLIGGLTGYRVTGAKLWIPRPSCAPISEPDRAQPPERARRNASEIAERSRT
jgi:hypothetical protein